MSSLSRELVFLILQFLDEEKFKETVHKLEQESGFYFNMHYFEEAVVTGEWDDVERYLSGFTKVDDNRYSMKIFFEIRKQKYLEALDRQDRAKAVEILVKDLKVFASFNDELYKEITSLLTLDNFRDNEQLSKYGDTKSARNIMLLELRKLIEANPLFRDKLSFPALKLSRLRTLINQSLNWQHQLCKNPRPNPDIKTLFVDHTCGPVATNGMPRVPLASGANANAAGPKAGASFQLGAHAAFQPSASIPGPTAGLASWMGPSAAVPTPPAAAPPVTSKRPRSPIGLPDGYEEGIKRLKDYHETATAAAAPTLPPPNLEDLPRNVIRTLHQGSTVTTMDFHPFQHSTLLVGTNTGDVAVWDLRQSEKKVEVRFKSQIVHDTSIAINRAVWSPEGRLIGAAFSKRVVHVFSYNPTVMEVALHLEIDAHNGGVNDIAFASPKQLCVITCGDDHTIKIWDASSGRKQYTFEGHEAPVYSVCPHHKENIQFIFSTAIDGRIKAWLYDHLGSRVDYVAPGNWCTTMAYSADGNRLFSCGTSKDGETSLVEWNESEGAIRRAYKGFRRGGPSGMHGVHQVVQFDTTKNRFLAAGDDGYIKFWDMDNAEILTQVDADGGLPLSPRVRFNKLGNLLAVNADNNHFKVLATKDGMALLRDFDVRKGTPPQLGAPKNEVMTSAVTSSKPSTPAAAPPASEPTPPPTSIVPRSREEEVVASIMAEKRSAALVPPTTPTPKLLEFSEPSEVRSVRCPDTLPPAKIARLLYTNAGTSLLALTVTAVHKVWKWTRSNLDRKLDPSSAWVLWQPSNGTMMTNDTSPETRLETTSHCIALSKNDSYVMSASGGRVSLYNLLTFKVMTMFMPPPPAATVLTFHPDNNNIIAIGMDDASVQIYNVRNDEVETKLSGHSKPITGLAFLSGAKLLVSAGADAEVCVWSITSWSKRRSKTLPLTTGGETRVQAHQDQSRILVTHETMLGVYDVDTLELLTRWSPKDAEHFSDPISAAAYSCDSAFVFAGFTNGAVAVFDASTLTPVTRIALSVYSLRPVYPVVIAGHPTKANQFALGSSDGSVYVLEPLDGVPDWTKKEAEETESKAVVSQADQGEQARKHEVS